LSEDEEWFGAVQPMIQDDYFLNILRLKLKVDGEAAIYLLNALDLPLSNLNAGEATAIKFLSMVSIRLMTNRLALKGDLDIDDLAFIQQAKAHLIARVARAKGGFERRMIATRRIETVQPQPKTRGLIQRLLGKGEE